MLAPIALFTYNRPDHTQVTLDSLIRNDLAAQSHLFIFSDGPKNEGDVALVEAVRSLVRGVFGFASVTLIERSQNMGLAHSVITGVTELLDKHESVIVLEDDLVTSRYFLSYMNRALDNYCGDPLAFSVTGHTFPKEFLHIPYDYPFDTYAGYRCSSWSWGTWSSRWKLIDWEMEYFPSFYSDIEAQLHFNRGGQDMTRLLHHQHKRKIDSWAIRFCYGHHANDMRCIYPIKSLVRNIGLDYSGTHSKPDPRFTHDNLDDSWLPTILCPADFVDSRITVSFRSVFDAPSGIQKQLRKIKNLTLLIQFHMLALSSRINRGLFPIVQNNEILMVSTFQKKGGAARAAYRAFLGVKSVYPSAQYLTLIKEDVRGDVIGHYHRSIKGLLAMWFVSLNRIPKFRYQNRQSLPFTPAFLDNPLHKSLSRFNPKLVHLHWVASSMPSLEELAHVKVPVVWTLHDTWAFTGGCHYTGGCYRFQNQCGNCPQLGSTDPNDISHRLWQRKQRVLAGMNLTIVAPSRWLAEVARQSSLFAGLRVEVIPNGLDTEVFRPIEKTRARFYLGINTLHPILLFGAERLTDQRKGADLLRDVISEIDFPCTLLTFGSGNLPPTTNSYVTMRALGNLSDDNSLAMAYSAADAFLCLSREDNLPNTVAEAMACGAPCVAFNVTGLTEMIEHKKTGWLAKAFDPADLVAGVRWLVGHSHPEQLRQIVREKALAEYSMSVMTQRYTALYEELFGTPPVR